MLMFFVLGISISVFLEFLLLIKKDKSPADKILLIWLLLLFVHQLLNYLARSGALYQYPYLLGIDFWMPVAHGVLLYFYVLEITGKKLKNKWFVILHLLPTMSLIFLAIPFYLLSPTEKINVFKNGAEDYGWYVIYQTILMFVSGLTYSIWSLFLIHKHQINIRQNFSNTDKKELLWLQYLSIGLGIIWFLTLFSNNTIIFSGVVVFVLFIGFFGINQLNIFYSKPIAEIASIKEGDKENTQTSATRIPVSKRYAKSGLTEETAEQLYTDLNQLMNSESLFNDNDITLTELAKRLQIHPNYLSQVINEKEQKNFYNYINALRIKEFIRLAALPENKKFTLLSLAYQCGFNSKSTFNKHFKENTGKTPSEYFKKKN